MLKNCSHCDHCFAKMNGNIFCELDGMSIKDPYEEVDCEYHTLIGKDDEDIKVKLNEIADGLVDLYVKIKYLLRDEDEPTIAPKNDEKEWVRDDVKINSPSPIEINDETMEAILKKLFS